MRSHQNRHRRHIGSDGEGLICRHAGVANAVSRNRHHLVAANRGRGVAEAVGRRGIGIHQHSVHVERHRTDRRSSRRRRAGRQQRAASLHHRAGHRRRQRHHRRSGRGGGDVQGHHGRPGLVAIRVGGDRSDDVAAHALGAERRAGERRVEHPLVGRALARGRSGQENSIRIEINSRHRDVVGRVGGEEHLRSQGRRGGGGRCAASACRGGHLHGGRTARRYIHRHVQAGAGFSDQTHVVSRLHRQLVGAGPGYRRRPSSGVAVGIAHLHAHRH